jgi:hypothetical protein
VAEGSSEVARIDTVNPVASLVASTTATSLLANNAQTFNYTYNDG